MFFFSKFGEDLLPTGGRILLTIFLVLRSQQVFITKANSHVMLFNFQLYSCALSYVVRFVFELITIEINSSDINKSTKKIIGPRVMVFTVGVSLQSAYKHCRVCGGRLVVAKKSKRTIYSSHAILRKGA